MDGLAITKSPGSPYTVLDEASREIRLLELLPGDHDSDLVINLHVKTLQEGLRYITLSYVWGKERCPRPVQVNDKHLTIGRNLDCALRHIRDNITDLLAGTIMLWVDALCIDQMDVQERSQQVRIMGQIYASAIDMVIWLGPEREDTAFILAKIRGGKLPEGTEVLPVLKALKRLCRRPWFGRLWIAQEFALSTDPNILIGHQSLRWNCFHDFVGRVHDRAKAVTRGMSKEWPYETCDYLARASMRVINLGYIKRNIDASLSDQLEDTASLLSSDPRDKVYGLLDICKSTFDHVEIKPDYTKSVQRVFAEITFAMLLESFCPYATFALQPQYSDAPGRAIVPTRMTGLPSWVLDLSIDTKQPFFFLGAPGRPASFCESHAIGFMDLSRRCGLQAQIKVDEEFTRLSVVGNHLGTIVKTTGSLFDTKGDVFGRSMSPEVMYDAYLMIAKHRQIPLRTFMLAILGEGLASSEVEAAHMQDLQDLLSTQDFSGLKDNYMYRVDNVVFVTEEGQVGRAYHPDFENGIRAGDVVVGLFGINYPFILRKVPAEDGEEAVYTMVNVAYIVNHQWGHDFVESAPYGTEWPNIEEYGLQRYTIV